MPIDADVQLETVPRSRYNSTKNVSHAAKTDAVEAEGHTIDPCDTATPNRSPLRKFTVMTALCVSNTRLSDSEYLRINVRNVVNSVHCCTQQHACGDSCSYNLRGSQFRIRLRLDKRRIPVGNGDLGTNMG